MCRPYSSVKWNNWNYLQTRRWSAPGHADFTGVLLLRNFFFSYLKQEFCTRSKKMPSTDPVPFSYFVWWTVIKGDIIEFSLGEYSRGPLDTKSSEPHSSVHSWGDAYPAFPNSQMHFPALTSFLYNAFLVWQHGIETYFTPKYPLYSYPQT